MQQVYDSENDTKQLKHFLFLICRQICQAGSAALNEALKLLRALSVHMHSWTQQSDAALEGAQRSFLLLPPSPTF